MRVMQSFRGDAGLSLMLVSVACGMWAVSPCVYHAWYGPACWLDGGMAIWRGEEARRADHVTHGSLIT